MCSYIKSYLFSLKNSNQDTRLPYGSTYPLGPSGKRGFRGQGLSSGDHMTLGDGWASKLRELELELCHIQERSCCQLTGLSWRTQDPAPSADTYLWDMSTRRRELHRWNQVCDTLPNYILWRCEPMEMSKETVTWCDSSLGKKKQCFWQALLTEVVFKLHWSICSSVYKPNARTMSQLQ